MYAFDGERPALPGQRLPARRRTEGSDGPWGPAPAGSGARGGRLQFVQDRGRDRPAGRADPPRRARPRARHGAGPAAEGRPGLLQGRAVGRAQWRGPDRGTLLLQPLSTGRGRSGPSSSCPATRSASGSPSAGTTCPPGRSSPSQARRGSSARCSSRDAIRTTPTPRRSSCTTPVTIPAGFRGVVTLLAGRAAEGPQRLPGRAKASAGSRRRRSSRGPITSIPTRRGSAWSIAGPRGSTSARTPR